MKLAISGTYSSGKTLMVMALSHYTGVTRTLAKTIREILPDAVPGKSLAQCTPAEYLQLMMRRHVGRAVNESLLSNGFIADGSSLQEWIYGKVRVKYGMNPSSMEEQTDITHELTPEMQFFEQVVDQFGHAFRQHVQSTFDAFVHLRNEFPIAKDGHRPLNERFRVECDRLLLETLNDLALPHIVIGGSLAERMDTIVTHFHLPVVMTVDNAIALARQEYAQLDMRLETERTASLARSGTKLS